MIRLKLETKLLSYTLMSHTRHTFPDEFVRFIFIFHNNLYYILDILSVCVHFFLLSSLYYMGGIYLLASGDMEAQLRIARVHGYVSYE